MASVTLNVPTMYADHHVLQAKEVLAAMPGVDEVYASAAWQAVVVAYDAEKVQPAALEKAMADAGYPLDKAPPVLATTEGEHYIDPNWSALGPRTSQTNERDREMSIDYRRQ